MTTVIIFKMKKIFSYVVLAVAFFMAAACSKSVEEAGKEEYIEVSFTIQADNIATRAISDGTKADRLYYVIFKGNEAGTKTTVEDTLKNITFPYQLTLRLAKGNTYTGFFFAQNQELQPYIINTADGCSAILTADYSKMATGDDRADAFYAYHNFAVYAGHSEEVTLKRAVAQVNLGTIAYEDFNATAASPLDVVQVNFWDIPTRVQLRDGSVLSTTEYHQSFRPVDSPMSDEVLTVNDEEYTWLAMNYMLAPSAGTEIVKAQYYLVAENNVPITGTGASNFPVRMNYRTNILGQILTGDIEFTIVIDEDFNTPDYVVDAN